MKGNKTIDWSKIGETVEASEISRQKYTTGGKWRKNEIIEFLKWCEKNLPKDKAKKLTVDDVFNLFYQPNNETLKSLKSNEKRLISFTRTFVKTSNKIAKEHGINVHIGIVDKVNIKIQRQSNK